jgi:hypothetical protein
MPAILRLEGKRYGRLLVLREGYDTQRKYATWVCRCDCGNEKISRTDLLNSGRVRSCGCLQKESARAAGRKNALPPGVSAFNALYDSYRRTAIRFGKKFELSKQQAKELFQSPCHYCGTEPAQIFRNRTCIHYFIYNGIDRLANHRGYVRGNVVAACKVCNYVKRAMDHSELMQWVSRVAKKHRL